MQLEVPHRRRRVMSLTPLIDVVFLLLIFFMLTSSFLDIRALSVSAPALGTTTTAKDATLRVGIAADGRLDLDGQTLSLTEIEARVRARVARRPEQRVELVPESSVPLQRIIAVIDRLAAAGARTLSLGRRGGGGR